MQEEGASPNAKPFFKSLLKSCVLLSHWPKLVTRQTGEMNDTFCLKELPFHFAKWYSGENGESHFFNITVYKAMIKDVDPVEDRE